MTTSIHMNEKEMKFKTQFRLALAPLQALSSSMCPMATILDSEIQHLSFSQKVPVG